MRICIVCTLADEILHRLPRVLRRCVPLPPDEVLPSTLDPADVRDIVDRVECLLALGLGLLEWRLRRGCALAASASLALARPRAQAWRRGPFVWQRASAAWLSEDNFGFVTPRIWVRDATN
eukprot:2389064-Prymnesium_polylepis.1